MAVVDPAEGAPAYICDCVAGYDNCDGNPDNGRLQACLHLQPVKLLRTLTFGPVCLTLAKCAMHSAFLNE